MQAEHKVIVIGPQDLRQAKAIEDEYRKAGTESWREERIVDGRSLVWSFGYQTWGSSIYGILVGIGDYDNSENRFPIIAVQDQNSKLSLAARSLVFKDRESSPISRRQEKTRAPAAPLRGGPRPLSVPPALRPAAW
jgi:hypothetical protein